MLCKTLKRKLGISANGPWKRLDGPQRLEPRQMMDGFGLLGPATLPTTLAKPALTQSAISDAFAASSVGTTVVAQAATGQLTKSDFENTVFEESHLSDELPTDHIEPQHVEELFGDHSAEGEPPSVLREPTNVGLDGALGLPNNHISPQHVLELFGGEVSLGTDSSQDLINPDSERDNNAEEADDTELGPRISSEELDDLRARKSELDQEIATMSERVAKNQVTRDAAQLFLEELIGRGADSETIDVIEGVRDSSQDLVDKQDDELQDLIEERDRICEEIAELESSVELAFTAEGGMIEFGDPRVYDDGHSGHDPTPEGTNDIDSAPSDFQDDVKTSTNDEDTEDRFDESDFAEVATFVTQTIGSFFGEIPFAIGAAGNLFGGFQEFFVGSPADTTAGKIHDSSIGTVLSFVPAVGVLQAAGAGIDLLGEYVFDVNVGSSDVISAQNAVRFQGALIVDGVRLVIGDPDAGDALHALNRKLHSDDAGFVGGVIVNAGDVTGEFVAKAYYDVMIFLGIENDPSQPI